MKPEESNCTNIQAMSKREAATGHTQSLQTPVDELSPREWQTYQETPADLILNRWHGLYRPVSIILYVYSHEEHWRQHTNASMLNDKS